MHTGRKQQRRNADERVKEDRQTERDGEQR